MPTRDSPPPSADAATSTICGRYTGVAPRAAITSVQCDDVVTGRYVVIQIPGPDNCLALCEVEIYCEYTEDVCEWVYEANKKGYIIFLIVQ